MYNMHPYFHGTSEIAHSGVITFSLHHNKQVINCWTVVIMALWLIGQPCMAVHRGNLLAR